MRIVLLIFLLVFLYNDALSQVTCDTIYLNKGKKVIGTISQQYGNTIVKIKTLKGNIASYNNNLIRKLGFGYKKEMESSIILSNGDSLCGEILERKYNYFVKIKTSENKIVNLLDSEIINIKRRNYNFSKEYIVHLKDQNIFWGTIETNNNLIIVKNIWTNQFTQIKLTDILKIDSIPTSSIETQKTIHLKDSMQMVGYLDSGSSDYMFLRTNKYGVFLVKKDEISKIDDFLENTTIVKSLTVTDTSKSNYIVNVNKPNSLFTSIKDSVNMYNLNVVASLGFINSQTFYCLPQVGINMMFFKFNRYHLSSEIRLGLSTNLEFANSSINLVPIILMYSVEPNYSVEIMPDIHIRLFDGGTRTTLGLICGVIYKANSNYDLKFRLGYSSGLYFGISSKYKINL